MTTPMRIRSVRSGDWTQFEILVAGICGYHGDKHGLTRPQFDNFATRENAPVIVLVAETENGILAGFVAGYPVYSFQAGKTSFDIQNLYIADDFRRQRIGEVLMMGIMQAAQRKYGEVTFQLGALPWNEPALEFYKQMGFTPPLNSRGTIHLVKEVGQEKTL